MGKDNMQRPNSSASNKEPSPDDAAPEHTRQQQRNQSKPKSKARRRTYVMNNDFMNPALAPSPSPPGGSTVALSLDDKVDVICSAGNCSHKYQGNCEYLELISRHVKTLNEAGNNDDSTAIHKAAEDIVKAVRGKGGRFLKRQATDTWWIDIGDISATDKTTRQLRQDLKKLGETGAKADGPSDEAEMEEDDDDEKPDLVRSGGDDVVNNLKKAKRGKRELNVEEKANLELLPLPEREQVLKLLELEPWDVKAAVKIIHIPEFYEPGALRVNTLQREILDCVKVNGNLGKPPKPLLGSDNLPPTPKTTATEGTANKRASCPPRIMEPENATNMDGVLLEASQDGRGETKKKGTRIPQDLLSHGNHPGMILARHFAPRRSCPPGFLSPQPSKRGKINASVVRKLEPVRPLPASFLGPLISANANPSSMPVAGNVFSLPPAFDLAGKNGPDKKWNCDAPPPDYYSTSQTTPRRPASKLQHPGQFRWIGEEHDSYPANNSPPLPKLNLSPESENSMLGKGYQGMVIDKDLHSILHCNESSNSSSSLSFGGNNCQTSSPATYQEEDDATSTTTATTTGTPRQVEIIFEEPEIPASLSNKGIIVDEEKAMAELQALADFLELESTGWRC